MVGSHFHVGDIWKKLRRNHFITKKYYGFSVFVPCPFAMIMHECETVAVEGQFQFDYPSTHE